MANSIDNIAADTAASAATVATKPRKPRIVRTAGKVERKVNEAAAAADKRTKGATDGMAAGLLPPMFGRNDRTLVEVASADGGTHQRLAYARALYDGKGTMFDVPTAQLRMVAVGAPLWARPYGQTDFAWFVGREATPRAMLRGTFERSGDTFAYRGDDVAPLVFANDAALRKAANAMLAKYVARIRELRPRTTDAELRATRSIARLLALGLVLPAK